MSEITVGVSTGGPAVDRAVRWAAERASARGIRLRLVHVIDERGVTGAGALVEAAEEQARRGLQLAMDAAFEVDPTLEIVTVLEHGSTVEVLEQRSHDAELLVVGSDWHGGHRPSRRGVTSLRIAAASASPVAVIPDIDVSGRRGVVVGADGSEPSAHAIRFAADEAERLGEPLIAVHAWDVVAMVGGDYGYGTPVVVVNDLERAAGEELDAAIADLPTTHPGLVVEPEVVTGDPVHVLVEKAVNAKLLVVGSHGRGALARFLLGSVSHGVMANLEAPTVVVR
jgi:nucleotide-binding universal stress UspA family protein